MKFETKAVHVGSHPDTETGGIAPPLQLATTFERTAEGEASRGFDYIRDAHPTQTRLEAALAAIDSASHALAFASGLAAGAALMQSLPAGSHVVLPDDSYYGMRNLALEYFPQWNLEASFADMADLAAVRAAMRANTKLIWGETPSNPLMKVSDIAGLASIAHESKALLGVDSTFATPALQRPIELGADLVLHSMTKYLGGHSDVMGGSLAFAKHDELAQRVEHTRHLTGGIASPFNCWLVHRGIRTLAPRMRVHCANARAIAEFLASHPNVEAVHYPGLAGDPGHAIAKKQMSDYGGMLSFRVRGGRAEALAVTAKVKVFTRATSLGGVESLVEHRASSEGPTSRTPENLLRMSVGLEHVEDLVEDLKAALR